MVFNDRPTYKDRHAAELIVARRDDLHSKAEYIAADLSIARSFSLQSCGGPYIIITYPASPDLRPCVLNSDGMLIIRFVYH